MKILLVSQYFWPEAFRINDLAEELNNRGHDITVLTGKPNYPEGKIYKGYKLWGYSKEVKNNYKIIRVPLIPRGNATGFRLAINYISYVLFSIIHILFNREKYDVTLTFAISPITQIYPALVHKKLMGSKSYIWVQDFWPESVVAAGKTNNTFVLSVLSKMVRHIYNSVDGILIQSNAFKNSICKLGDYSDKIHYVPNWAEDLYSDNRFIDYERYMKIIPSGFNIIFAGNIGESQDFDSILKAAEILKDVDVNWIIIGDGRKKIEYEQRAINLGLRKMLFLGRFPVNEMPSFFVHADALLVTLSDAYIFSLTIPSKLQSYMAFGKPILTMLNGVGNTIINQAECGYTASSGDYENLATNILKMSKSTNDELLRLSNNSSSYYIRNFSKSEILNNLENILIKS